MTESQDCRSVLMGSESQITTSTTKTPNLASQSLHEDLHNDSCNASKKSQARQRQLARGVHNKLETNAPSPPVYSDSELEAGAEAEEQELDELDELDGTGGTSLRLQLAGVGGIGMKSASSPTGRRRAASPKAIKSARSCSSRDLRTSRSQEGAYLASGGGLRGG